MKPLYDRGIVWVQANVVRALLYAMAAGGVIVILIRLII